MSTETPPPMLDHLHFDNRFTGDLPADTETGNFPRQVHGCCFSRVIPARVTEPKLIGYSREVAELLDLAGDPFVDDHFAEIFSGHRQLPEMDPYATCYGGHQFGNWAGQLGDGRAINLGEIVNQRGERWALQLKGAGRTPYSRTADGLAVLRSSLREFLCSEAMFHLGVPTTRALSLVLTGEEVVRDMFYDGNPKVEPGAVVCRVAPSFTRFGHFQIFASRNDVDLLQQLVNYTLRTDFPHLGAPSRETYLALFDEVCRTTAEMIVHWMRVGFVHGVMNTDNMSILGLTIDYGPYGWLEDYDPNWTPNTTDAMGRRYRFGHQPQVAMWNLAQFANALLPLVEQVEPLQESLDAYTDHYKRGWETTMAAKLGLRHFEPATDKALSDDLFSVLQLVETDMTLFFRKLAVLDIDQLSDENADDETLMQPLLDAYYEPSQLTNSERTQIAGWLRRYGARLKQDDLSETTRRDRMNSVNPKYVLRNYLAQLAIDKAEAGDLSLLNELLELLRHPYDEQPGQDEFAAKRPEWARHRAGCSMLSCSS